MRLSFSVNGIRPNSATNCAIRLFQAVQGSHSQSLAWLFEYDSKFTNSLFFIAFHRLAIVANKYGTPIQRGTQTRAMTRILRYRLQARTASSTWDATGKHTTQRQPIGWDGGCGSAGAAIDSAKVATLAFVEDSLGQLSCGTWALFSSGEFMPTIFTSPRPNYYCPNSVNALKSCYTRPPRMCNGFAILSGSSTFSTIENTQLIANEDTSTIGFVFSNHRTPQTLASFRKKRLLFAFGRRADPTYSAAAAFVQNHAGLSSFRESTTRPQPGDVAKTCSPSHPTKRRSQTFPNYFLAVLR